MSSFWDPFVSSSMCNVVATSRSRARIAVRRVIGQVPDLYDITVGGDLPRAMLRRASVTF